MNGEGCIYFNLIKIERASHFNPFEKYIKN